MQFEFSVDVTQKSSNKNDVGRYVLANEELFYIRCLIATIMSANLYGSASAIWTHFFKK